MKTRSLLLAALLGFSTSFAVAQNAPLSAALTAQVQTAVSQGNGDALTQLADQNPNSAAQIAQFAVQAANSMVASDPAAAGRIAAAASQIAATKAVTDAAPS